MLIWKPRYAGAPGRSMVGRIEVKGFSKARCQTKKGDSRSFRFIACLDRIQ
jgi:hypothetical protein